MTDKMRVWADQQQTQFSSISRLPALAAVAASGFMMTATAAPISVSLQHDSPHGNTIDRLPSGLTTLPVSPHSTTHE